MKIKFSEDVIPVSDLKVNPGSERDYFKRKKIWRLFLRVDYW